MGVPQVFGQFQWLSSCQAGALSARAKRRTAGELALQTIPARTPQQTPLPPQSGPTRSRGTGLPQPRHADRRIELSLQVGGQLVVKSALIGVAGIVARGLEPLGC